MIELRHDRAHHDLLEKDGETWLCETFEWVRVVAEEGRPQSVRLVRDGHEREVPWSERAQAHTFSVDSAATYEIEWSDGNVSDKAILEAAPSALKPDEMRTMLDQVGEMALNLAALALNRHRVRTGEHKGGEPGVRTATDTRLNDRAEWLRRLISTIETEFEAVRRAPCRDLAHRPGPVMVERSTAPSHLILRKTRPNVRRVRGVAAEETFNTPENRWLRHLLFVVLDRLVEAEGGGADVLLYDEEKRNAARDKADGEREELKRRLRALRSDAFLKDVKDCPRLPSPTMRLKTRAGYAGIYQAYAEELDRSAIERLERLRDTVERTKNGGVRKLSNLYELWCLFRLYTDLRTNLGLAPVGDEPQDAVELVDGRLEFGSKRSFALSKSPFAGEELKVTLDYDQVRERKDGGYYRPDFVLTIESPKRTLGGGTMVVVLDAKYHEYGSMGGKERLINARFSLRKDVECTALKKYAQGLKRPVDASFILHPCKDYEWRGERPYNDFLKPEIEGLDHPWLRHPGHQIGALLYKPGDDAARARLLTILFHHLLGLTGFCLNCGNEVKSDAQYIDNQTGLPKVPGKDRWVSSDDPQSAFHVTCDVCDQSWNVSFCRNRATTLHSHSADEKPYKDSREPTNRFRRNNRIVQSNSQEQGSFSIHSYRDSQASCPLCHATYSET